MTERSIAELIGWELVGEGGGMFPISTWRVGRLAEDVIRTLDDVPYTPDDLLAWLRGQDVAVWPGQTPYDDSCALTDSPLFLCVKRADDDTLCMDPAPTLLAALEAAVRAVAEEAP